MKYKGPINLRLTGTQNSIRVPFLVAQGRRMLGALEVRAAGGTGAVADVWESPEGDVVRAHWTPQVATCEVRVAEGGTSDTATHADSQSFVRVYEWEVCPIGVLAKERRAQRQGFSEGEIVDEGEHCDFYVSATPLRGTSVGERPVPPRSKKVKEFGEGSQREGEVDLYSEAKRALGVWSGAHSTYASVSGREYVLAGARLSFCRLGGDNVLRLPWVAPTVGGQPAPGLKTVELFNYISSIGFSQPSSLEDLNIKYEESGGQYPVIVVGSADGAVEFTVPVDDDTAFEAGTPQAKERMQYVSDGVDVYTPSLWAQDGQGSYHPFDHRSLLEGKLIIQYVLDEKVVFTLLDRLHGGMSPRGKQSEIATLELYPDGSVSWANVNPISKKLVSRLNNEIDYGVPGEVLKHEWELSWDNYSRVSKQVLDVTDNPAQIFAVGSVSDFRGYVNPEYVYMEADVTHEYLTGWRETEKSENVLGEPTTVVRDFSIVRNSARMYYSFGPNMPVASWYNIVYWDGDDSPANSTLVGGMRFSNSVGQRFPGLTGPTRENGWFFTSTGGVPQEIDYEVLVHDTPSEQILVRAELASSCNYTYDASTTGDVSYTATYTLTINQSAGISSAALTGVESGGDGGSMSVYGEVFTDTLVTGGLYVDIVRTDQNQEGSVYTALDFERKLRKANQVSHTFSFLKVNDDPPTPVGDVGLITDNDRLGGPQDYSKSTGPVELRGKTSVGDTTILWDDFDEYEIADWDIFSNPRVFSYVRNGVTFVEVVLTEVLLRGVVYRDYLEDNAVDEEDNFISLLFGVTPDGTVYNVIPYDGFVARENGEPITDILDVAYNRATGQVLTQRVGEPELVFCYVFHPDRAATSQVNRT